MNRKKIIKTLVSLASLAMLLTMVLAFGVTAHAAENSTPVTTGEELKTAIQNASENETPTVIDIQNDITDAWIDPITNKNIIINLNGYKLHLLYSALITNEETKLTINGRGEIRGDSDEYGNHEAILMNNKSTVTLNNLQVFGASKSIGFPEGGCGIQMWDTATLNLDNVLVRSGDSANEGNSKSAISFDESNNIYVKNSTFQKGAGTNEINGFFVIGGGGLPLGSVYENGTKIEIPKDATKTEFIVGEGFANKVDGSTITEGDGTPVTAIAPVTATTTIPSPTYTVTIPAVVDFGAQTQALEKYRTAAKDQFDKPVVVTKDIAITATGVSNLFNDLGDGKADYIDVTVAFNGKLSGTTSASNEVPFTMSQGNTVLTTGAKVATFYNEVDLGKDSRPATNAATAQMALNRCDIKNADSYTGTLTFNIAVADAVA